MRSISKYASTVWNPILEPVKILLKTSKINFSLQLRCSLGLKKHDCSYENVQLTLNPQNLSIRRRNSDK